jgi:hypothetical protein
MSTILQEHELPADVSNIRLDEMRKILSSQTFAKAPRLYSFLSYIVEKSVEGDVDSLTEQQIGIFVFNRHPGYNSNDDNIVRGTARSLRQRLATYYLTEGLHDAIRIDIPKGAYVAQFKELSEVDRLEGIDRDAGANDHGLELQSSSELRWQLWLAWSLVLVVTAIACWPLVHSHVVLSRDKSNLLWNTVFTRDKITYLVPGDAGLNMYEVLEGRTVDLNSYTQQTYHLNPATTTNVGDVLGARFYTTMSDLQLVSRLIRLPQADPGRVQVRFARDLSANELKDANLVLMGTSSYNPWTELFQKQLSLQMSWDVTLDLFTVVNRTPQPGEQPVYQWTVKNGVQGGLTLISLTDNSQGSGRVLLIEGTTMNGVYAASDFLSNKQLLDPILARAQRPDGTVRNFDILLRSDFIREGVSNLHVLAAHVH